MEQDQSSHLRIRQVAAGSVTWLVLVLLTSPFLTYCFGLLLSKVMGLKPYQILHLSFLASVLLVSYAFYLHRQRLLKWIVPCFPDLWQCVIVVVFAYAVAFPRLLIVPQEYSLAVYDDFWHYQKIVSVFATFPNFKHYFFPELGFSYYFYAYLIPAVFYTMKTGLNLKLIWLLYMFVISIAVPMAMLTCFNRFLPRKRLYRIIFALCVTVAGGCHEWYSVFQNGCFKHTEWWALKLGLPLQVSSYFTIHFWAPQHLCGLALFCLLYYLVRNYPHQRYTAYCYGVIVGLLAGFSVYIALFACLYLAIFLIRKAFEDISDAIVTAIKITAATVLSILPILSFFLDREQTIAIAANISQLPSYLLFLLAEFGVFLILFVCYIVLHLRNRHANRRGVAAIDIWFVISSFAIIFLVRSKGFNVLSYRGIMPAQVILLFVAVSTLPLLKRKNKVFLFLIYTLIFVQMTAFIPELVAMTKLCYEKSYQQAKLAPFIQQINNATDFGTVVEWTAEDAATTPTSELYLYNIFRMKDVDKDLVRKNKIDKNNLVYLNKTDREKLLNPRPKK